MFTNINAIHCIFKDDTEYFPYQRNQNFSYAFLLRDLYKRKYYSHKHLTGFRFTRFVWLALCGQIHIQNIKQNHFDFILT